MNAENAPHANKVNVTFCINVGRERCLLEQEIESGFDQYRDVLLANDQQYGALIISRQGDPDVIIDDEVWAMVQNLCFLAVREALAGQRQEVSYFRYPSSLYLTPTGDRILLASEFIPAVSFPLRDLFTALYHCGLRYIDFLRRLAEYEPAYRVTADELAGHAEIARHALDLS